METQSNTYIKCSGCNCLRAEDEYEVYKGTRRKNCLKCKEKRAKKRVKLSYQNGKIYRLISSQTNEVYIGSTTQALQKRKSEHNQNFKYWQNGKYHYISSFELCKYDDMDIELVEEYPCKSKNELEKRESEIIRSTEHCINISKYVGVEGRREYRREYKKVNSERIRKYESKNIQCECGLISQRKQIQRHKRTTKHHRLMTQLNIKETKQNKWTWLIICECGEAIQRKAIKIHQQSQKHQKYIASTA